MLRMHRGCSPNLYPVSTASHRCLRPRAAVGPEVLSPRCQAGEALGKDGALRVLVWPQGRVRAGGLRPRRIPVQTLCILPLPGYGIRRAEAQPSGSGVG